MNVFLYQLVIVHAAVKKTEIKGRREGILSSLLSVKVFPQVLHL